MSRLAVLVGSTRQVRFADHPAAWVTARLARQDGVETDVIDLRDFNLPDFDGPPPAIHPRAYAWPEVERLGRRLDGFLVLTPEYNHGYPAALKNAMDHTFAEWVRKPIAFVGWGNVGGSRAIEQLRAVAVEFEMAPVRHAVHILPDVMRAVRAAEDPDDLALFAVLDDRLDRLIVDLLWWTSALNEARAGRS